LLISRLTGPSRSPSRLIAAVASPSVTSAHSAAAVPPAEATRRIVSASSSGDRAIGRSGDEPDRRTGGSQRLGQHAADPAACAGDHGHRPG
jgi:hypothetical protein